MAIDPHIFRAYDIRGKAGTQLTAETCRLIGRGFGSTLREIYGIDHPTLAVGRDARTHSPELHEAVIDGLRSTGCHVVDIGITPSPVNYFTICQRHLDGGIQVTASHNGPEDNGLKLQMREAEAFAGHDLQILRARIERQDFLEGEGDLSSADAISPYLDVLGDMFGSIGTGMRIAVDSGNGVAGPTYTEAMRRTGAEIHGLYIEPDGTFPHHLADPSKWDTLKDLQQLVNTKSIQLGFAFDGDGDRVGLVDETGTIRTADDILLLLARDHLTRHTGAPIIFTVSNSGALESEIKRWRGKPIMCKVGHSFVEHAMREHASLLGGEQSGHFFCGENYFGFDDALVAALHVVRISHESGEPLSTLFADFPRVYQAPEQRPHCPDDRKGSIIAAATQYFAQQYPVVTLDGARIDFGEDAWAGIRQSNTAPRLSICIEARSPEKLRQVEDIVLGHLRTYPEIDWNNH